MKIGDLEIEVSAPDAERLLESTGQSIAAMHSLLDGHVIANIVAKALSACVKGEHDVDELTARIANQGVDEVRMLVREHYAEALQPAPQAPAPSPAPSAPDAPAKEAAPAVDPKAEPQTPPKEPSGNDGQK